MLGLAAQASRRGRVRWVRTLREGGPRSRPRDIATAWNHMHYVRPVLLAWSSQYGHLREVTRDDVLDRRGELHGARRSNVLVALWSLFAFCKKRKTIFRSPVQGIRVGERTWGIIQPLSQEEAGQAAEAATTPEARLGLVLAAMRAARVKAIREIRLDDVDLGNRRIVIGGRVRPLDDLTHEVLIEWLAYRSARWPSTANPYLLASQRSANGTGPVSTGYFAAAALRGKAATLERLPPWKGSAPAGSSRRPSPSARTRCTWPRFVRPRPQDRDPLRGKRPATAHHSRRGTRSRWLTRRRMTDPSLQAALRAGADGLYALEACTG